MNFIANVSSFYTPQPPPVRMTHQAVIANENDEEKHLRAAFANIAGDDMEISPKELMDVLNKVIKKYPNLKTDGFSLECCRSMVALMDSDCSGKLGFEEFKYLWNNIKKWQKIYCNFDADCSGTINGSEIQRVIQAAGFNLDGKLVDLITRRYADETGNIDFDNYIACLTRLDCMFRAFTTLDKDNDGKIRIRTPEFLVMTMYS